MFGRGDLLEEGGIYWGGNLLVEGASFTRGYTFQSRFESTSRGGLNLDSFKSYATGSELKSSCERSLFGTGSLLGEGGVYLEERGGGGGGGRGRGRGGGNCKLIVFPSFIPRTTDPSASVALQKALGVYDRFHFSELYPRRKFEHFKR